MASYLRTNWKEKVKTWKKWNEKLGPLDIRDNRSTTYSYLVELYQNSGNLHIENIKYFVPATPFPWTYFAFLQRLTSTTKFFHFQYADDVASQTMHHNVLQCNSNIMYRTYNSVGPTVNVRKTKSLCQPLGPVHHNTELWRITESFPSSFCSRVFLNRDLFISTKATTLYDYPSFYHGSDTWTAYRVPLPQSSMYPRIFMARLNTSCQYSPVYQQQKHWSSNNSSGGLVMLSGRPKTISQRGSDIGNSRKVSTMLEDRKTFQKHFLLF